jgi:HAD superfamily hydrolase (TIGR01509 family)
MGTRSEPSRRRPIRALFWDNDGVLVDTEHLFFQATSEVLARHGVSLTQELYIEYTMRRGRSLFELLAERGSGADRIGHVRAIRDERYAELLRAGVRVLDGVRETLASLQGRLPMAIVTASGREHFDLIHAHSGLLGHFEFVVADGDYARHKPEPDAYLAAAERLGVDPRDCVAVEDSERGLQAAVSAGMRCLVVPSGFSIGGDFQAAECVLESASDVPGALFGGRQ